MSLLACPFCREMFDESEARQCPDCDIPLVAMHRLPPSQEAIEAEAVAWEQDAPEDERLPWHHFGSGRGPLLVIALSSLCSFWFAPWVSISSPHEELRTGYALAVGRLGWLWGGAVAWMVEVALIASRRSLRELRGVRAISTLFAAMTGAEIVMLMVLTPAGSQFVQFSLEWGYGLYGSLLLSLAGVAFSLRLGASARMPRQPAPPEPESLRAGESPTLH